MKYYQLVDVSLPERWYLQGLWDHSNTRLDSREFRYGKIIAVTPQMKIHSYDGTLVDVTFPLRIGVRKPGIPLDFTFDTCDVPIVTGEVAHLLLDIEPDLLQVFPVQIETTRDDFFIINATSRLACIDRERSKLDLWNESDGRADKIGKPKAIYQLALDSAMARGHHVFRLEGWEIALIVSEKLKKAFEKINVKGVGFLEV